MVTHVQAMMFCECLSKNEKFPEMNSVNMSEPDRISLLCVPPMKSWENNPTTKQGKQIISPQTNC